MMTRSQIERVLSELERTRLRCEDVLAERTDLMKDSPAWVGSPATGALRRASMDLTRELAKLRSYNR
jgi:hypothetical protein